MVSIVPLLIILAAASALAPSEAPHASPLTEIGRVRSAPICTPIVVHANGAITSALDNDRSLAILTHNLRAIDFDGLNSMQRRNAIEELMKTASTVRENGKVADGEIKQLRAYAAASTDPDRKAELKAFADALGGAIYRQTKVAAEFVSDITVIQGRTEAEEARGLMAANNAVPTSLVQNRMAQAQSVLPGAPKSYNAEMRGIAGELTEHSQGITSDEGIAADHSIAATSGC
jgi:hypothetical protein